MKDIDHDDQNLRELLMGRIGDEERDALEARLLADDDLAERAALLEDELAEAYAAGTLSAGDRAAFARRLERVARLRERLARARAFDRLAGRRAVPQAASWAHRVLAALRPPPVALPWSFATGLLVAVGAGLMARGQIETLRREAVSMREERDLARAEGGRLAGSRTPASPLAFVLSPGSTRDEAEIATLRLPPEGRVLLLLDPDPPAAAVAYRAVLRDASGAQVFARDDLRPAARDGATVIEIEVEARLLPAGRYELRLEALGAGRPRPAGSYVFRVSAPRDAGPPA